MIILTMVCDRCSKETEIDLTGTSSLDLNGQLRKEGFQYVNANKKNMLICTGCANKYKELVGLHQERAYKEVCEFFDNCKGKDNNGNNNGAEDDRS
jgi:hypothetical protein